MGFYTIPLKKEILKEYTFEELRELEVKEYKKERELQDIQNEKLRVMDYLEKKIKTYFGRNDIVEIKDNKCYIITDNIDLNFLEELQEDLNLANIKALYNAGKIKIELMWW